MLDMKKILNYPYEFELNLNLPDSMVSEILKSLVIGKVIKDCWIIFHEGYFEVILDINLLVISKQVKLSLEIEKIELSKEALIVTLKEHDNSHSALLGLIGMLGKDITSWLNITDNNITINLTDKWLSFLQKHDYIFGSWKSLNLKELKISRETIILLIDNTI